MAIVSSPSPRRLLSCRTLPPVQKSRRTPSLAHEFGEGLVVPAILSRRSWTDAPLSFVLTERDDCRQGRYELAIYRDGEHVATVHHDDERSAELIAEVKAEVARQDDHTAACAAFEAFLAAEDRLPAPIRGGSPEADRPRRFEPSAEDRLWWAETSDRETRQFTARHSRGVNVTDEDVLVATGSVG